MGKRHPHLRRCSSCWRLKSKVLLRWTKKCRKSIFHVVLKCFFQSFDIVRSRISLVQWLFGATAIRRPNSLYARLDVTSGTLEIMFTKRRRRHLYSIGDSINVGRGSGWLNTAWPASIARWKFATCMIKNGFVVLWAVSHLSGYIYISVVVGCDGLWGLMSFATGSTSWRRLRRPALPSCQ